MPPEKLSHTDAADTAATPLEAARRALNSDQEPDPEDDRKTKSWRKAHGGGHRYSGEDAFESQLPPNLIPAAGM